MFGIRVMAGSLLLVAAPTNGTSAEQAGMTQTLLVVAVAGMVATVNPCGFAMLPAYLALVVTGASEQSRARLPTRAVVSSG